jgi:hypothetical protein
MHSGPVRFLRRISDQPVAGLTITLAAMVALWLGAMRAYLTLEDGTDAQLARSAAAYLAVVTPGDGGAGYNPSRLLSGLGALAISSFWSGGVQGALGRTALLPDTIGLVPLSDEALARLTAGAGEIFDNHARYRAALAPLLDRDRSGTLGWVAVWGALGHRSPSALVGWLFALAALGIASLPLVPAPRRPRAVAGCAALFLAFGGGLGQDLADTARQATEVKLRVVGRLIEIAGTADRARRTRLADIAAGLGVDRATLEPSERFGVEYVRRQGLTYARAVAPAPWAGEAAGLELLARPSRGEIPGTWWLMAGLLLVGCGGLALALPHAGLSSGEAILHRGD